jgi:mono/diheme cytochrome c family protein
MRNLLAGLVTSAGLALFVSIFALLMPSGEAIPQTRSDRQTSLAAWERMATVLQHPRCSNCHQPEEPLQGDGGRRHSPRVVRGRDNMGVPGMRCGSCHSAQGNNEASRVPGATDWKMPPRSMSWAKLPIGQLCRTLKDPTKNGRRSLKAIIKHIEEDSLVHWSWDPGGARESIAMPHHVFVEFAEEWVRSGAHCPD